MKKLALLGALLLMQLVAATTIKLEADMQELSVNETIGFHLEISPSGPAGGNLAVYREIEPNRLAITQVLYHKPSPGQQCYSCAGGTPLSEYLSRDFYFTPKYDGNYYAEANFGNARKLVNFTVIGFATTMNISSTTTTSSSSSSTTSMSTTLEPTPTIPDVTTSLIPKNEKTVFDGLMRYIYVLIFLLLTIALIYLFKRLVGK